MAQNAVKSKLSKPTTHSAHSAKQRSKQPKRYLASKTNRKDANAAKVQKDLKKRGGKLTEGLEKTLAGRAGWVEMVGKEGRKDKGKPLKTGKDKK